MHDFLMILTKKISIGFLNNWHDGILDNLGAGGGLCSELPAG